MFRTDLLFIIRSLNTVFTAIGICHTSDVDCLLARSGWTVNLSETCRVLYQNKVEKRCILLAFIVRIALYTVVFKRPNQWFMMVTNLAATVNLRLF